MVYQISYIDGGGRPVGPLIDIHNSRNVNLILDLYKRWPFSALIKAGIKNPWDVDKIAWIQNDKIKMSRDYVGRDDIYPSHSSF